jgi:sodium pump decarboxylase gamma subunit
VDPRTTVNAQSTILKDHFMGQLMLDGVKLMVMGMVTVLVFLVLMVILMNLMAKLLSPLAKARFLEPAPAPAKKAAAKKPAADKAE